MMMFEVLSEGEMQEKYFATDCERCREVFLLAAVSRNLLVHDELLRLTLSSFCQVIKCSKLQTKRNLLRATQNDLQQQKA